jgi:hypothetical protein
MRHARRQPIVAAAAALAAWLWLGAALAGHEPMARDLTIRRYTGKVTALAPPDAQGKVYGFSSAPVGPHNYPPQQDDLRGWRLTVLSGKRFGSEFRISGNDRTDIRVNADHGPVDGLAANDVFVIESVDANGGSMFTTPSPQNVAPAGAS